MITPGTANLISPACELNCHLFYLFALVILTQCMVKSRITRDKPESMVGKCDKSLY